LNNISTDILEKVKEGDADAFTDIVDAYQNAIYNLCYRMLYNRTEAEDATQETFWKAWTNFSKYDFNRSFSTWILSIAAHYCIDLQRKKKVPEIEIDETMEEIIPDPIPHPEQEAIKNEEEQQIQDMLNSLNETDRAAIVLRYWYDFSDREIAESLSVSESAVKSRLFRARKQLAQYWDGQTQFNQG